MQLVGLTATVGIGDSKSKLEAKEYMLSVCARLGLKSLPKQVVEHKEGLNKVLDPPFEGSTINVNAN